MKMGKIAFLRLNSRFVATPLAVTLSLAFSAASLAGIDKDVSDVCKKSTDASFRDKYCKAAKDNQKGYVANRATAAIWGGVSAVCLVACGKPAVGTACKLSSTGGSVGEGALSNQFVNALIGQGSAHTQDLANLGKKAPTEEVSTAAEAGAEHAKKGLNGDACMTAGTSALKSFQKVSNANVNEKSLGELKEQTKAMNTDKNSGPNYLAGTAGGKIESTSGDHLAATGSTAEICSENALRSALGAIRCAAQADPSLPPYVKSEEFLKDLASATGKTPDAFFAGFKSPAETVLSSPTLASLSTTGQQGVAESLSAMERYSNQNARKALHESATGAGATAGNARRGSVGESGDDQFDVNGMLIQALGGLGEKKTDGNTADVTEIAGANRRPSGTISPEDRKTSLFDRVMWRYGAVSARDHLGNESVVTGGNPR